MADIQAQVDEKIIARDCQAIAVLWKPAILIAYRLANPNDQHAGGGRSRYSHPHSPVNDRMLDQLGYITDWLVTAATCEETDERSMQLTRADAINLAHAGRVSQLANYVADNASILAKQYDQKDWVAEANRYVRMIRRICGEQPDVYYPDVWRKHTIAWQPQLIADILTRITGHPVTSHQLRQAAYTRKITPINGQVNLGEVASAVGL